jgi:outer membrane protein
MKKLTLSLNIILPAVLLLSALGLKAEVKMGTAPKAPVAVAKKSSSSDNGSSLVIKVVSGREILTSSDEGKKLELELTQKRAGIEAQGQKMEQELKNDITTLQGKAKVMDTAALEAQQDKLISKEKGFKAKIESLQEEFSRTVNRDLAKFNGKINDKVVSVAKEKGWDLVVLKESGEVIHASDKVDASKDIIAVLNKEFKSPKA